MGLPVNNKKAGKAGAAGSKNAAQASKFISKPGTKAVGVAKKPLNRGIGEVVEKMADIRSQMSGV